MCMLLINIFHNIKYCFSSITLFFSPHPKTDTKLRGQNFTYYVHVKLKLFTCCFRYTIKLLLCYVKIIQVSKHKHIFTGTTVQQVRVY